MKILFNEKTRNRLIIIINVIDILFVEKMKKQDCCFKSVEFCNAFCKK